MVKVKETKQERQKRRFISEILLCDIALCLFTPGEGYRLARSMYVLQHKKISTLSVHFVPIQCLGAF